MKRRYNERFRRQWPDNVVHGVHFQILFAGFLVALYGVFLGLRALWLWLARL